MTRGLKKAESVNLPSAETESAPNNPRGTDPRRAIVVSTTSRPPVPRGYFPAIAGIAAVVGAGVGWAWLSFGSLRDAWLYAGGARVVITPRVAAVLDGRAGDEREAVFVVRNLADRTVNVLGVTTSCACISADKLPVAIEPKGRKELHLTLRLGKSPGERTEQTVVYHTDHPAAPGLGVRITGRVLEP